MARQPYFGYTLVLLNKNELKIFKLQFRLIDGVNITMSDEHMWLIPFTLGENHLLTVTLKQPMDITGLRVWNYNKSSESTYRGVCMF